MLHLAIALAMLFHALSCQQSPVHWIGVKIYYVFLDKIVLNQQEFLELNADLFEIVCTIPVISIILKDKRVYNCFMVFK